MAPQANKANLGIPTEYDLPLAEGVISLSTPKYWRDGSNNVGISGTVSFSEKPTSAQTIAVLPVGYRPTSSKNLVIKMSDAPHTSFYGWIYANGTIGITGAALSETINGKSAFALIVPPFYAAL